MKSLACKQPKAITYTKVIESCKCESNIIKVIYNGERGSIECEECHNKTEGYMLLNDLIGKWNNINKEDK